MKKWFVRVAVILCLMLAATGILMSAASAETGSSSVPASEQQHAKNAAMTVMVYMSGSELESQFGIATSEIREMIESGYDDDAVNLLIMIGGAKNWASGYDPDQTTILQCSSAKKAVRIVNKLPAMSMGDPETLSCFLRYGTENFPADAYSLILWGHGAGPLSGFCHDEKYNMDPLTLEELDSALSASPFSSQKLAWIGFEVSETASIEIADKMARYADYMIAPQSDELIEGWNYSFLKGLESDSDGAETGKRIIDAIFMEERKPSVYEAFSCVRLDRINHIEASMDEMFTKIAGMIDQESFPDFAEKLGFTQHTDVMMRHFDTGLADLVSLCNALADDDPEGAARTKEAVEEAVVYTRSDGKTSCGLTVYHPNSLSQYDSQYREAYRRLNFCPGYTAYIDVLFRFLTGGDPEI